MSEHVKKLLLNDLQVVLPSEPYMDQWVRLKNENVEAISRRGFEEGAALINEVWIPKKLIRCDGLSNLYVQKFFYLRTFSEVPDNL